MALPGVPSPQDPTAQVVPANLGRSKGFEGMALGHDGRRPYPLLEGRVAGDPDQDLRIHQFDTRTGRYAGKVWRLRTEHPANAIGDLVAVDQHPCWPPWPAPAQAQGRVLAEAMGPPAPAGRPGASPGAGAPARTPVPPGTAFAAGRGRP